jgi:gliding motility-associated-like protein
VQNPVAKPAVTTEYTVTVTDANGCTATSQVTIAVADPLALSYTALTYNGGWNVSCNGASDGEIDLTINGGEAPFVIAWTGPDGFTSVDPDITALKAGGYTVTVTDANGCTAITTVNLLEPAVVVLGRTADVLLACNGDATATGSFSVSGGTAAYTFNVLANTAGATIIETSGTSRSFTGGHAGVVTIEVIDANGCSDEATITITEPIPIDPGEITGSHEVCYGGDPSLLGEVTGASGGPASILYQWEKATIITGPYTAIGGTNTATYDPPAGLFETTYYRRRATSGTCPPEYTAPVTVTVNPLPVASIAGTATICPLDPATITVTVTTGATPFKVVLSDGTTVEDYVSGDPIVVNPDVTTTYSIVSVTDFKGCNVSAPHANLTGTATITVKIVPGILIQPLPATVCEGDNAVFTVNAGLTTNPTYQWYVDRNDTFGPQPLGGETGSTLTVATLSAYNGYKYSVVVSGDCPSPVTSDEVLLTVNELPEIQTPPSAVIICSGEDAVFTVDAGVTTNPTYIWYVNTSGTWNIATGPRYTGTYTSTLTVAAVIESMTGYQYMVRVSGTCSPYIESVPVSLTVTRQAEITQQPLDVTLCEGEDATFTVNAGLTTGPSYEWQLFDGTNWNTLPGETSPVLTLTSVTSAMNGNTYRVIVYSSCGSSLNSNTVILTVNERPEIMDQPDDAEVCENYQAQFTVDAGVTTGVNYRWQVSTDGGSTWANISDGSAYTGTLTAVLTVNNPLRTMNGWQYHVLVSGTCTPMVPSNAATLIVNTRPEVLDHPDDVSICENTNTSFTVSAQGTGIDYQWFVDQGLGGGWELIENVGIYTGATDPTLVLTGVPRSYDGFKYRVEVTGDCTPSAFSLPATLSVDIETVINEQPADTAICEFNTATFSIGAEGAVQTYQWQVMNPGDVAWSNVVNEAGKYAGATQPVLLVFNAGRAMDGTRYQVIIGSKCTADITSVVATLNIYTAPEIDTHPADVTACPADNISYSVVAQGYDLSYQWQVNMGGSFTDIPEGGDYTGTDTPTLNVANINLGMNGWAYRVVITGRCTPAVTSSIARLNVTPEPMIFQHPEDAKICAGFNTWFLTSVFIGAIETVQWEVYTGGAWSNVINGGVYQGATTQQLTLNNVPVTGYNGNRYRLRIDAVCGQYFTDEAVLTVNANPTALISPLDTIDVCGGVTLPLNGNPAGGTTVFTQHRWSGDVAPLSSFIIQDPDFRTTIGGNYKLAYTVTDSEGCIGSDTVVVRVERPVALFTASTTAGCTDLEVVFTNLSTGYASLEWNFGDGSPVSTDESPTHTFVNSTTTLQYHEVILTVTSPKGCIDTRTIGITVYPETESSFTISDNVICSGETVALAADPGGFNYKWVYGDGEDMDGTSVNYHTYYNSGLTPVIYDVTLTTTSFLLCTSTTTHQITVFPMPAAEFTATPPLQTFPAATVTFNNLTNGGTWTYLWRFGDGNTSNDAGPTHTYAAPGDYNVTLIVSNSNCVDSVTHMVRVMPTPPIANFDDVASGCGPLTVTMNNTSLYATSYLWEFGDGGVSTASNPTYTYSVPGIYRITLTAYGPGGVNINDSHIVEVYQNPRAYFEFTPEKVFVNDERVRFFNLSQWASYYIWEFGDGDTSHVKDPFHKYLVKGIFDVTLHAYSENGCVDSYTASPGVLVEPAGTIRFATAFIPNKDGPQTGVTPTPATIDQFFFPPVTEQVEKYKLQIFNRWGVLIFESKDINIGWDGYYKNKLVKQGVYVWLVEGKYANGKPFRKSGDVTVLH